MCLRPKYVKFAEFCKQLTVSDFKKPTHYLLFFRSRLNIEWHDEKASTTV
ncbi:hypothetical protein HMPREF0645_0344 [Hallella bergensis DSM 17361]|uniref:Uncharacterized protein n=1 Tax=Hallella bergensis DSM 17361 TaxID=585502 RepID=D1PTQ9_9BACT|nr:hypothetical protein HMPREF0645_0344 [Hallella bergensis DSM 17361]